MHASASQLALVLLLIGWKGGANLLSQSHRVESAKPITFRHSNENRSIRSIGENCRGESDFSFLITIQWYGLNGSTPLPVPQFASLARKGRQINKILEKSLLSYTEPVRTLTNIYDREIRIEFNSYWTRLSMMWRIVQIVDRYAPRLNGPKWRRVEDKSLRKTALFICPPCI